MITKCLINKCNNIILKNTLNFSAKLLNNKKSYTFLVRNNINNYTRQKFLMSCIKKHFCVKHNDNDDNTKDIDNDFKPVYKESNKNAENNELLEDINNIVKSNDVVLFMKGTKEMPRCGFSNYLIQVLKFYKIENFKDVNVLENESLRQAVKDYSNWPTFPQLYIKSELIGGCDIVKEMHENGTFQELCERNSIVLDK